MYLLKFLAKSGVCSRRKAELLVKSGLVFVNGEVATNPFMDICASDSVVYDGRELKKQNLVYIIINKPKGLITTCSDEFGRDSVMTIIEGATNSRVYPIGRLDRMSTGLLLITNDGLIAQKLSHPSYEITKTYRVLLDKPFSKNDQEKLINGFELEDGFIKVDGLSTGESKNDVTVKLHSGRNRIVRRMFDYLGYNVKKLDRIGYGNLSLNGLGRGQWRFLTQNEIFSLGF